MSSVEMMKKFLLSSIRDGMRECLSSSLLSPPGELVREELWGGCWYGDNNIIRGVVSF